MPIFEDIRNQSFWLRLDISTNSEPEWDTYIWKSKFSVCWQPVRNQILKIENITTVIV